MTKFCITLEYALIIAHKGRSPDSDSEEIRSKRCAKILEQVFGPPELYNEITVLDTLRSKALAEVQANLAICVRDIEMILAFIRKKDKELQLKKGKGQREEHAAVVLRSTSASLGNDQSTAMTKESGKGYTIFRKTSSMDKSGFKYNDKSQIAEQNIEIEKPATTVEGLILKATTSSKEHEEETLTQKLEDIREVPLVEAEPKYDILNPPKTLGPPTLNATIFELPGTNFDAKSGTDELARKYLQEITEIQGQIIKDMELLGISCDKRGTKYKGVLYKTVLERNLGALSEEINLQKETVAGSETKVRKENQPVSIGAAKARVEAAFTKHPKTMSFDLKDWKYFNDSFRHHYTEYTKNFCIDKDEVSQSPCSRIFLQDHLHAYNCQMAEVGLEKDLEDPAGIFFRAQAFSEDQATIKNEPLRSVQIFIDESLSKINLNNETAAESFRRMREQDRIIYCREIGRQMAKNLAVLNLCPPRKSGSGPCKKVDPRCRPKCPPPRNPCPSPVKAPCIPDPPKPPPKPRPPPCPCPPPACPCPPLPKPPPVTFKCPPAAKPCPPAECPCPGPCAAAPEKQSQSKKPPQVKPQCPSKQSPDTSTCTCPPTPKVTCPPLPQGPSNGKSPLCGPTCTPPKPPSPSTPPRKSPLSDTCQRPAAPKKKCPKFPPHPQSTDIPGVPECNPPSLKCPPPSSVCPPCPTPKPKCPPTATKSPDTKPSAKPWKGPKCPWTKPCGGPPFCSFVGIPRGIALRWTPSEDFSKKSLLPVLPKNYCIITKTGANSKSPLVAQHYTFAFQLEDIYVVRMMGPKDYTPWSPIPSWPYPVKQKKRRLQCPKEGCPIPLPPRVRPRCLQFPCPGFPKRLSKFTKIE